jgi:hypothetical protein
MRSGANAYRDTAGLRAQRGVLERRVPEWRRGLKDALGTPLGMKKGLLRRGRLDCRGHTLRTHLKGCDAVSQDLRGATSFSDRRQQNRCTPYERLRELSTH